MKYICLTAQTAGACGLPAAPFPASGCGGTPGLREAREGFQARGPFGPPDGAARQARPGALCEAEGAGAEAGMTGRRLDLLCPLDLRHLPLPPGLMTVAPVGS